MSPSSVPLPSLKVTVRRGSASFLRLELVGVHGEAHGTSGFAPVEAGVDQYLVQPFLLGLILDEAGSGHDHGVYAVGDLTSLGDGGDVANVLDPAVGAGTDENLFDGHALNVLSSLEANVLQGTLDGGLPRFVVVGGVDLGHLALDGHGVLGGGPPGDGGGDVLRLDDDGLVVLGALVGAEGGPVVHGSIPLFARGAHGPALEIIEGDLVGSDHSGAGAGLDGHVGDGHSRLHGQRFDGGAGEFDGRAGASRGTDEAADVKDNVLGGDALPEFAIDPDEHVLCLGLGEGLCRQHVLHLAGPDPERQRAERPVGGGMTVPADGRASGQGEPLLRADDVDDALTLVGHAEIFEPEIGHVGLQLQDLRAAGGLLDELGHVDEGGAIGRGDVVIDGGQGAVGTADAAGGQAQSLEGLGGGDFVHEMAIDVQQGGQAVVGYDVVVPDLVVQSAGLGLVG
mmetsp:Transcript_21506/g.62977  ORF Transcript_21506/g.62977 Transcript_21506/m.62977 type:complete len:454 (-) Transcript_21506:323-1684(-)